MNLKKWGSEMKTNKYLYGWKLYVNYGSGWEYETFEETFADYKVNQKAYAENCSYPQRWSNGRETNPDYKSMEVTQ
jgi:hypothetical protein